jgi:hypothetical protein
MLPMPWRGNDINPALQICLELFGGVIVGGNQQSASSGLYVVYRRLRGGSQLAIEDDPGRVAPPLWETHGQLGVVSEHRAGTGQDAINSITQTMDRFPAGSTGDPLRFSGRGSQLAIEGHGRLKHHERQPGGDVFGERRNQAPAFRAQRAGSYGDPSGTQPCQAFSGNAGVGINCPVENPAHAGSNERFSARSGATLVTTRFEGHVEIGPAGLLSGIPQGENFGVRSAGRWMVALADDPSVMDQYGPDRRIRRGSSLAATGQLDGPGHEALDVRGCESISAHFGASCMN